MRVSLIDRLPSDPFENLAPLSDEEMATHSLEYQYQGPHLFVLDLMELEILAE